MITLSAATRAPACSSTARLTAFQHITDGASHTMLFGEALGERGEDGYEHEYSFAWISSGAMVTSWGLKKNVWCKFASRHPNVVQFCFADGSVHGVSRDIDYWTYVRLSRMRDGAPSERLY